ncbi:D-alanyl-lipoteichoic acid acyltransferase DltB, MBOAT superfamily [Epilithonimonas pallida]|uniref:D-alanyl-lipoteichoic acid acyltransferase DltB, MBOAT superfamily n=1 Tax=Epilithonimonas pallida TaxID=373671 RepID=A0ABY1R4W0_9FLAO|nr:D-alanyl-lipoteichoic acid acyltransferase DltB, MBOAT superfamily [Epilithonimonas pallida]
MLFNSLEFFFFFVVVFFLYWFIPIRKWKFRNLLLLIASYYFYSQWDWRFCFLLGFSTLLDYFSGIAIERSTKKSVKKIWLFLSIIINVGILGYFKYVNFFIESFNDLLVSIGFQPNIFSLNVILPIGISFYTFHGLSYVLDIYFGKFKVEKNIINYSLFVCFFPMLLAGPIERAPHLLPQLTKGHEFDYNKIVDGMRQFLWGFFKKVVVADNCANIVNMVFEDPGNYSGMTLIYAAFLFIFQVYADFSGYSDMALGTSRMFGIQLMKNFDTPFFSRDMAEFVGRWHISLSTWFKYYIYKPAVKENSSNIRKYFFVFLIFLISGFWHGARWTYIVVGFFAAVFVIISIFLRPYTNRFIHNYKTALKPSVGHILMVILNLLAATFLAVIFRNDDMHSSNAYFYGIITRFSFHFPHYLSWILLLLIFFMLVIEWIGRMDYHILEKIGKNWPTFYRWGFYILILLLIALAMPKNQEEFIYFQF